mgnify:CR=1 FL=1
MTLLCASLNSPTPEAFLEDAHLLASEVDVFELRLDYLKNPDAAQVSELIPKINTPCIATLRHENCGGKSILSDSQRVSILEAAAQAGADYVDIELESTATPDLSGTGAKRICSYHNFSETPANLREIYSRIRDKSPDIIKIAAYAQRIEDNARVFSLLNQSEIPCIALCMGECGVISRILAPKFGASLMFCATEDGNECAPGQITADELLNRFNFRSINPDTELYGVIGNPIQHSISPDLHNSAYRELGLNKVYVPLKVENPQAFWQAFGQGLFDGFSVTIPHKRSFLSKMDHIEPVAEQIGAVNTLRLNGGRWEAYNTDWRAAIDSIIRRSGELKDSKVLILGAGGAARALGFGAQYHGASVAVTNRTEEKGRTLCSELNAEFIPLQDLNTESVRDFHVIINTTSLGMHPNIDTRPLTDATFHSGQVVFDAVYNPEMTRLLQDAQADGAQIVTGTEMFVGQAEEQFRLWCQCDPPQGLMKKVFTARKNH